MLTVFKRSHRTQHNDTEHNDTQYNKNVRYSSGQYSIAHAKCHNKAYYTEWRQAERRYAKCREVFLLS